jgi:hypothetical protein
MSRPPELLVTVMSALALAGACQRMQGGPGDDRGAGRGQADRGGGRPGQDDYRGRGQREPAAPAEALA